MLLRALVLSGAASSPLRVLATSQMSLTDCGKALLLATAAYGGPGPLCSWPLVAAHIVLQAVVPPDG